MILLIARLDFQMSSLFILSMNCICIPRGLKNNLFPATGSNVIPRGAGPVE